MYQYPKYELCRIVRQESICLYVRMYGLSMVRGLCAMVEGQILSLTPNQTQSRSICFQVLKHFYIMFEPRFKSYFIMRLKLLKDLSWVLEW